MNQQHRHYYWVQIYSFAFSIGIVSAYDEYLIQHKITQTVLKRKKTGTCRQCSNPIHCSWNQEVIHYSNQKKCHTSNVRVWWKLDKIIFLSKNVDFCPQQMSRMPKITSYDNIFIQANDVMMTKTIRLNSEIIYYLDTKFTEITFPLNLHQIAQ